MQPSPFHFIDSHRTIDWNKHIQSANQSIVICVYYWDKWMKEHEKSLCEFLNKPNTTLQFVFSDALDEVQRLFPNHTIESLEKKIEQTYQPLKQAFPAKVLVSKVPHPLNYSLQCFDDSTLFLSVFEMYRTKQVDSPSIQIDLNQNPNTKKFYEKEIQHLVAFKGW